MNLSDILSELNSGKLVEHKFPGIELKESWAENHGQKISGLANKDLDGPRWLVVGVRDNGSLVGNLEDWARKNEEIISQHVNTNLDPSHAVKSINCVEVNSSWIIAIEVERPGDIVHWKKKAYKMAGTTAAEMDAGEALKLRLTLPGLVDFSKQHSDSEYIENLLARFSSGIREGGVTASNALDKFELRGKQAARILFGNCTYRVVVFDLQANVVMNETRKGLFGLLAPEFIQEIEQRTKAISGKDKGSYSSVALKEGLSNAVAHAAFFEKDGELIIEIYPHKLCISNLCTKDASAFANKWFSRRHQTTNGLLMEVLRIAGSVDELGLGKTKIISETIRMGHRPPEVIVEEASRYSRWKLWLYGGIPDSKTVKILSQSRKIFQDEGKALIGLSLVHWKGRKLEEVREYVDGDYSRQFAEVLSEYDGPVWHSEATGTISLSRWARLMLSEGKSSKELEPQEETRIKERLFETAKKNWGGKISNANVKRFADLGKSTAANNQASKLLKKWCAEGTIKKIHKGKYEVIPEGVNSSEVLQKLLDLFASTTSKQAESK